MYYGKGIDMSKSIQVIVQGQDGAISTSVIKAGAGKGGQPLALRALSNVSYEIRDLEKQVAPDQLMVRRHGKNLEIVLDIDGQQASANAPADVVIEGYFDLKDPSPVTGLSENGQYYAYVPQDGQVESLSWELKDGASSYQGLGYDEAGSAVPWWPFLVAGLVLLGGAAAASGGSGGGKGVAAAAVVNRPVADLEEDTGNSNDRITNNGTIIVSGIDPGATWYYSLNGGVDWEQGAGDSFVLPEGVYPADEVQVKQNFNGIDSEPTKLAMLVVDITPPSTPSVSLTGAGGGIGSRPADDADLSNRSDPVATSDNIMIIADLDEHEGYWEYSLNGGQTWTVGTGNQFIIPDGQYVADQIQIVQVDVAGNKSVPYKHPAIIIDNVAPEAATDLVVSLNGLTLTGKAEPNIKIEVKNADGEIIGEGVVSAGGNFSVTLDPAQKNGETLTVFVKDYAGHVSPDAKVIAGDLTPPAAAKDLLIADNGLQLSGKGEFGAYVTVRNAQGIIVGSGRINDENEADPNSSGFTVQLDSAFKNGERLSVTLHDEKQNYSTPASVNAQDLTPPAPPENVSINALGTIVTGRGQPGATVVVKDADGNEISTEAVVVPANGSFTVNLSPEQIAGDVLEVYLQDAGGPSAPVNLTSPDKTAPDEPTDLVFNDNGTALTGKGEPGTIAVAESGGRILGTVQVGGDGNFTIPLNPAQKNGETVSVTLTDGAGNKSAPANEDAPDITAPEPATNLFFNDAGTELKGRGEVGATVKLMIGDDEVVLLAPVVVDSDGNFTVDLDPALKEGQTVEVYLTDAYDNESDPAEVTAPLENAPARPTDLVIDDDGLTLTGKGAVGSTAKAFAADGTELGQIVVDVDGNFSIDLDPIQDNGQIVTVTLTNVGGTSLPGSVLAPDNHAPDKPTNLSVSDDGTTVTGNGQPGAGVAVVHDGNQIGSGVVDSDGNINVVISPPLLNGEEIEVTLNDGGGPSPTATVNAPDKTPPALASDLQVIDNGTVVTGKGEAEAQVIIRDAAGGIIGTGTVIADGTFSVVINPAQQNGEQLSVELVDASDNNSGKAYVVAADTTPPEPATDLEFSINGDQLFGKGEVGAKVIVMDSDDNEIGTGFVGNDGQFVIDIEPPLINGEAVNVILQDEIGNNSDVAPVQAPDLTPPNEAENLDVSADGTTLTGTGEPDATVKVYGVNGQEIGTSTVNGDGNFTVNLTPPQTNGQVVQVTLIDGNNNPSQPAFVQANYVFDAGDVAHDAELQITPTVVQTSQNDLQSNSMTSLLGLSLAPLTSKMLQANGAIEIEVGEGQIKDLSFQGSSSGLLSITDFDFYLLKVDETRVADDGSFLVETYADKQNWFYSALLLFPSTSTTLSYTLDQPGTYYAVLLSDIAVSLAATTRLSVTAETTTDYASFAAITLQNDDGNILSDLSNTSDIPAGSTITKVNDTEVTGSDPIDIVGTYGTLKVSTNGDYTYVLSDAYQQSPELNVVETFTYTVTAPNGKGSSTGELTITLDFDMPGSNPIAGRYASDEYDGLDFSALDADDSDESTADDLPDITLLLSDNHAGDIQYGGEENANSDPDNYTSDNDFSLLYAFNNLGEQDQLDGGYQV